MARMLGKAFIGKDTGTFVATIAEFISETAFDLIVTGRVVINKQPLILGTVRTSRRVRIITSMTVRAFDHRNIARRTFLLLVRTHQAYNRLVFPLAFHWVERLVGSRKFDPLVGCIERQVGAIGMAQIAELVFFGYLSIEIAHFLTLDSTEGRFRRDLVRVVAINAIRMSGSGRINLGQGLF